MEPKEEYSRIRKKHSLPELEELQRTFSFGKLDSDEPVLAGIRKRIDEKTDLMLKILNRILQPETTIAEMNECREFSEADKKRIFELYKRIMIIHNYLLMLEVDRDEKAEAEFISSAFKKWPSIKQEIKSIISKMRDSWQKEVEDLKEDVGYVG